MALEPGTANGDGPPLFNIRFQKIFACYVIPCVHSACIMYIMAAATMRIPISLYTIAVMVFVVCDILAWAVTTLGLLLCAPSFFETFLQAKMALKVFIWKGISMLFELLILLMLVLEQIVKKEQVIDCICVCGVVLAFSGVLGLIFLVYFRINLIDILKQLQDVMPDKGISEIASSFGGSTFTTPQHSEISGQNRTTDSRHNESPPERPVYPLGAPFLNIPPELRAKKNRVPYENKHLKVGTGQKHGGYEAPTIEKFTAFNVHGSEAIPIHNIGNPPTQELLLEDPPDDRAPTYFDRRSPEDPHPRPPPPLESFDAPPMNWSDHGIHIAAVHQQNPSNTSHELGTSDLNYNSIPPPPTTAAFEPPTEAFLAPPEIRGHHFDDDQSSYHNRL